MVLVKKWLRLVMNKKIALLLLREPKTEEELNKQLNIPHDKLTVELKGMIKLGLISKKGILQNTN